MKILKRKMKEVLLRGRVIGIVTVRIDGGCTKLD